MGSLAEIKKGIFPPYQLIYLNRNSMQLHKLSLSYNSFKSPISILS